MSAIQGNAALLRKLAAHADEVAESVSLDKFPILLRKLAERRRVTSVQFRPLLVDAMLITHLHGFRIFFNSRGRDPDELETRYYSETASHLTDSRSRFSLAHEFAHTMFYDLTCSPPRVARMFAAGGGKTALENLERNCDRLAAHLLLPSRLFESAMMGMKEISADSLRELAGRAGVSMEVIVRRLGARSDLLRQRYFFGCIAIVRDMPEGLIVRAVSMPKHLTIAQDLQLIQPGEKWQLTDAAGVAVQLSETAADNEILLATGVDQKRSSTLHRFQVSLLDRFESNATYLAILEATQNR